MNMDNDGYSLKEFLHSASEEEIADTIYEYGEERCSRKIASSIKKYVKLDKMTSTQNLVQAIEDVIPRRFLNKTLSRVFQALRIKINDELNKIYTSLLEAIDLLNNGGRIAVITFHSIEDRLIKNIFRTYSRGDSSYLLGFDDANNNSAVKLKLINKKAIAPQWSEIKLNKRSRSAKLRIAERVYA